MSALYFQLSDMRGNTAADMVAVTTVNPGMPETPPSPFLVLNDTAGLNILDLDQQPDRVAFAKILKAVPLYRITLELLIDRILLEARYNDVRTKGIRQAFAPEDPPEPITDPMAEKYAFQGNLHFPVIASRTDLQLLELYLRLYGPAFPDHIDPEIHLAAILNNSTGALLNHCDGFMWRGAGWTRFDRIVYDAERLDNDPEVTFESYVTRGRAGAEALEIAEPKGLLAAWIQAERVQRELCHDIDAALKLPDIRRLPQWVRADVFRVLEREAMKQVFAEGIIKCINEWPELRRSRLLYEPIEANAKGEAAALVQQMLNQTLSADAQYQGAGDAFVLQAERRWQEASKLLEQ